MIKKNLDAKRKEKSNRRGNHELITSMRQEINEASQERENEYIKVMYARKIAVLKCREIVMIRKENRITKFYTAHGIYMEYKPLIDIEALLPKYFIRCNASTIINRKYVRSYNHTGLVMENGEVLKIGRSFKNKVLNNNTEEDKEKW